MRQILWALLATLLVTVPVQAVIDSTTFSSEQQEQTYRQLTTQLRCPKCQNNNIADSNAAIATDMRTKVYQLVQQGYSKEQVIDYMVARYGNFVTYDPPLTPVTLLLWLVPLLFLLGAATVIYRLTLRAPQAQKEALSTEEQQRLQSLLDPQRREN
ncbi:MAG: cytochrome c-type biogenesis protein [Enterobacteriaceae bacterium]